MRKITVYILPALLLFTSCSKDKISENLKNSFITFYGGTGTNEGFDVKQLFDGSYIALGTTSTSDFGNQFYLLKVDQFGRKQWQKKFGGQYEDEGRSVQVMDNGDFILAGFSKMDNSTSPKYNIYMARTHPDGDLKWDIYLGGDTSLKANCIQFVSDREFVIAGSIEISGVNKALILFTDSSGINAKYVYNANDQKTFSGQANYIIKLTDGSYLFTGTTSYYDPGNTDLDFENLIVGVIKPENHLWSTYRLFGGKFNDAGHCVKQFPDGSFICVGTKVMNSSNTNSHIYMVKFKLNNDYPDSIWTKDFGYSNLDEGSSVDVVSDSLFLVSGTIGYSDGSMEICVLKVNGSGGILNETDNAIGGTNDLNANSIIKTLDGGFILTGTNKYSNSRSYMSLIKLSESEEIQ
jgi:hypothetical protein